MTLCGAFPVRIAKVEKLARRVDLGRSLWRPLLLVTTPLSLALEAASVNSTKVDPLAEFDIFHWSLLGMQ